MKKVTLLFIILLIISCLSISCGGGSGSSSSPNTINPGTPSIVQLLPSHYIAQTNTAITLNAKVLDGNGIAVRQIPVRFTNLSPVGNLSSTTAKTNDVGIATVTLKSTTDGFATIQAEVNSGIGQVRDRKTVFFSLFSTVQLEPKLTLEVSGNGDPYKLFESGVSNDSEVTVTATVYRGPFLAIGSVVTFGADRPYKVGSSDTCSDGSDTCDVIFPFGNTAITNDNGEASVFVRVVPTSLTSLETTLNIYAVSDTGAFNMVTLFLQPVSIKTVTISANPTTVESGGTSKIKAYVTTTAETPAPDGTTVSFTSNKGTIDPFSQTTDGWTEEVTFTAPEVIATTTATITGSVGGKSGSTTVTITPPVIPPTAFAIQPPEVTFTSGTVGNSAGYAIVGGVGPFIITSSHSSVTIAPPDTSTTPTPLRTFSATINTAITADTTVTITVVDTDNDEVATARFIIDIPEPPAP